jgi:colicin import membrane protein
MEALSINSGPGNLNEPALTKMIILSVLFHCLIFSSVLFVPEHIPTRRVGETVYEVNLVELPPKRRLKAEEGIKAKTGKMPASKRKNVPAKRITKPKKKEKPVVIAKRTVTKKNGKVRKPKVSSSRLIDQAVAKIEKKMMAEKKDHVEQAISELATRTKKMDKKRLFGSGSDNGITIRIYKMEVEDRVKNNWSYPVALVSARGRKDLEATVVVKVKNDGTILKSWFKRRSSDAVFDDSVLKAVDRSNPLPPFPEGYRKIYDEIEINFNLSELEDTL